MGISRERGVFHGPIQAQDGKPLTAIAIKLGPAACGTLVCLQYRSRDAMPRPTATQRTCPNGHKYWKSTDCPTCPRCEALRLGGEHFLPTLSAPAKRALEGAGIASIKELARRREADVMKLHGMGPASLPRMKEALKAAGLKFKA
jgi:hypothetical protein